eukprot:scaffold4902_cov115-Cylindrotheca_fusiformis.AAC.9
MGTPPQSPASKAQEIWRLSAIAAQEQVSRKNRHRKNAPSFDSSVASLTETESLIATLFPQVVRQPEDGECTFHLSNLRLEDSQRIKVQKYAKRRLAKMNWHVLKDVPYTLPTPTKHSQVVIGELVGEGSFSTVYARKSESSRKDKQQVVKVLRTKLLEDPAMLAACAADLVKEGWLLSLVAGNTNVVKIHGWQQYGLQTFANGYNDCFFLTLERLQVTLSEKIDQWKAAKSKLSNPFACFVRRKSNDGNNASVGETKLALLQERLEVIPPLARGLECLHKHAIIHRDLKPDNVGLSYDGVWKIFDLDVGQLCPTISVQECHQNAFKLTKRVGSPRYMSPECARGERYNCLTDVYSFGVLVHEILTCDKPYEEIPADLHDDLVFYQHRRPPISKSWPTSMRFLLESTWHKDWDQRPTLVEPSFHSSLVNRVIPEFVEYKTERYCPTPNANKTKNPTSFFKKTFRSHQSTKKERQVAMNSTNATAESATGADETSFATMLSSSMHADMPHEVVPKVTPAH